MASITLKLVVMFPNFGHRHFGIFTFPVSRFFQGLQHRNFEVIACRRMQNHFIALIVGGVGGALVVIAVPLIDKLKIDDVVGAISAHLVAGIWGTLCVGIFGGGSVVTQLIGIVAIGAFVSLVSAIVWFTLKATIGIRVDEEDEVLGLDKAECGMEAYPEFGTGSQTL